MNMSFDGAIKVAGHWELSWNAPIKEAELWNFPLRDFGIKDWFMWPVSGIKHNESRKVALHERHTFEAILEENQDLPHVYVEPYNPAFSDYIPIDLRKFAHPEDVLYIFGSAHFNPITFNHAREQDCMVAVPTVGNRGVLWPHQCLVTILYDRLVKGDSNSN
jgi:hypothetical protein